jgi:TolB-like protein/DNA-binding winged helix-turn-helix (wHTH) protein
MGESAGIVAFGEYELDFARRELRSGGNLVPLQPTPLRVLLHLAEQRDRTVPRRELLDAVWPGVAVGDEALTTALAEVRRAVGDDGDAQRVIRTQKGLGYRFVAEVVEQAVGPAEGPNPARRRRWLAASLVLVAAGALGALALNERGADAIARDLPPIRSLAVLPLANLSGDPEQEYYADGMTETLIAELSKLPGVRVISRTSVMQFKGTKTPLPEIAKALNVDGVIEGSVMRAENEVRITAQLIDARSDRHVWAEQYDRELARVLEIQSEVARAVAGQIALSLTPEQAARLKPPKPVDPRAQEAYFRGLAQLDLEGDLPAARSSFETAIELAPDFAPAWAALAHWLTGSCHMGCLDPARTGSEARAAAERALALDPDLGDAHTAMSHVHQLFDWNWRAAESEARRAAELSSRTDRWAGVALFYLLLELGRREEARAEFERWSSTFRGDLFTLMMREQFLVRTGEFERAVEEAATAVRLYPKSPGAHFSYAAALETVGSYEEAVRALRMALSLSGGSAAARQLEEGWRTGGKDGYLRAREEVVATVGLWFLAAIACAQRGDIEAAFAHLETAYAKRDPGLRMLTIDPWLRPLHADPRFAELARRMNLPAPNQ